MSRDLLSISLFVRYAPSLYSLWHDYNRGMTRDDLFNTNASIVQTLVKGVAEHAPNALIGIISNPVNSTVPIAAQVLREAGVYDKQKLCGVTTLDVLRANTFSGASQSVPVIGGHAGITILPLFSQVDMPANTDIAALTHRTQFGGDEVVQAKAGAGSATLSMAYAGYIFAENCLKALAGEEVEQCAFVESTVTDCEFFASPCRFGPNGVEEVLPLPTMSDFEQECMQKMLPDLQKQIQKGLEF